MHINCKLPLYLPSLRLDPSLSVVKKNISRCLQQSISLTGVSLIFLLLSACGGSSSDSADEPGDPAAAGESTDSEGMPPEEGGNEPVDEDTSPDETGDEPTDEGASISNPTSSPILENSDIEPPLGFAGEIRSVITPGESDPFSKFQLDDVLYTNNVYDCLLYTSPSPRDRQKSRMPSSA